MYHIQDRKAISKLLLLLLLLGALFLGATLSYMGVVGYFIELGIRVPQKSTLSIVDVTFTPHNASYFNVTFLNPSFSPSSANIIQIAISTNDDFYVVTKTTPTLPTELPKGEEKTFRCVWNWGNSTGQTIKVLAFIEDGSGPTYEKKTPLVDLEITDVHFNPSINVTHFNMTLQNNNKSVTYVNITGVNVEGFPIPSENISGYFPSQLTPGQTTMLQIHWRWSEYQDKTITITVDTLQNYIIQHRIKLPKAPTLSILEVNFNVLNTTQFNVTVQNSESSPTYVNITEATVQIENESLPIPVRLLPALSHSLYPGDNATFSGSWNWSTYRETPVNITVKSVQGVTASATKVTPARVILTITDVLFDVEDVAYFNVTVKNSEHSLENSVNVTEVTVIPEMETSHSFRIEPAIVLPANETATFTIPWNWSTYWNWEIAVGVTADGYSANRSVKTPAPVVISNVVFTPSDTEHFDLTVQNPELSSTYILVTKVSVILQNETFLDVKVLPPMTLPQLLHSNETSTFLCSWNWTNFQQETVTILVETVRGYRTTSSYQLPDIS